MSTSFSGRSGWSAENDKDATASYNFPKCNEAVFSAAVLMALGTGISSAGAGGGGMVSAPSPLLAGDGVMGGGMVTSTVTLNDPEYPTLRAP